MPVVSLRIPQIGEGLQEARLVAVLKQPGDQVRRDEPIYQMETDKAVMDVESPYEGTLVGWLAPVDTILPIGGEVGQMEVAEGVEEMAAGHGPAPAATSSTPTVTATTSTSGSAQRRLDVPPRTRAYAKEKGIGDDVLATIPAAGSKLMPDDIDAFLTGGVAAPLSTPASAFACDEAPLSAKQRLLSSRLVRGSQLVVPGTITVAANWGPIDNLRARIKASGDEFQPSAFTAFAFAATQALKEHPLFRSTLIGDGVLRTFHHVHLGIAVSLPSDELVIAVVDDADTLDWRTFAERSRAQIELARGGQDQAHEAVTVSLTNMQSFGLRQAVPVVVPPAVGTLFLGEVYNGLSPESDAEVIRCANLTLTFDHRVINGVPAAEFLNAVKRNVETISSLIPAP
ncbi:MAG TPA: 2-oxo acid dehydrogenase subunit E2 [Fimbriimonadaceae bacterium]|nr:2-oxo acid dehydrogenase subunit E2 [Fimbriimonadaceae bacterium]